MLCNCLACFVLHVLSVIVTGVISKLEPDSCLLEDWGE